MTIWQPGKLKRKRYSSLGALYKDEEKRLRFLGSIDYDDDADPDDEEDYENEEDEFEDAEEILAAEFLDFY